jgi:hypothetical protein
MGPSMAAWGVNLEHDRQSSGEYEHVCSAMSCVRSCDLWHARVRSYRLPIPLVKCVVLGKIVAARTQGA